MTARLSEAVLLAPSSSWLVVALALLLSGCRENPDKESPASTPRQEADRRDPVTGLTEAEAAEVLAQVGETKITLGQYAASLARMDRFERLRYQSEERQKQLLDEMIEVEILAQEARRRGLDEDPEVQLRLQQALRNELLEDLRRALPEPEEISERRVRDYYEEHRSELREPRRHRVLAIVLSDPNLASRVAQEATGSSGEKWGKLFRKYSVRRPPLGPSDPLELAGDLGFVSAPGKKRGENDEVPEKVREAVFTLDEVGDVAPQPVPVDGLYYVVRLGGVSEARDRSLRDADAAIRAELLRQRYLEAERKLHRELEKRYPVVIDREAIERLAAEVSGKQ